jgi:hypothetical protein
MAWYRIERVSTDPTTAGKMELTALMGDLDKALRANLKPNTIARHNARIYKNGNAEHWIVLVPPGVALVARDVLEQWEGNRLGENPPTNLGDYKAIEI